MHSKLLFSVYNNYLLLNIWVLYMWEPLWVVILEYLHIFLGAFKIDPLVWNYSWIIIPFIYPFLCNYWLLPCNFFITRFVVQQLWCFIFMESQSCLFLAAWVSGKYFMRILSWSSFRYFPCPHSSPPFSWGYSFTLWVL